MRHWSASTALPSDMPPPQLDNAGLRVPCLLLRPRQLPAALHPTSPYQILVGDDLCGLGHELNRLVPVAGLLQPGELLQLCIHRTDVGAALLLRRHLLL